MQKLWRSDFLCVWIEMRGEPKSLTGLGQTSRKASDLLIIFMPSTESTRWGHGRIRFGNVSKTTNKIVLWKLYQYIIIIIDHHSEQDKSLSKGHSNWMVVRTGLCLPSWTGWWYENHVGFKIVSKHCHCEWIEYSLRDVQGRWSSEQDPSFLLYPPVSIALCVLWLLFIDGV